VETNHIINCDPSYPQTTMQDFIINQAKMRQQYAATFKEDSPTKQLTRRITVMGGCFFQLYLAIFNTTKFFHQDALKLQALREVQAYSATQDLSRCLFIHLKRNSPHEERHENLTNVCIYNGEIRRSPLD
jgi:polyhydroxyalkanoate synthesis regulator protein